MGGRRVRWIGSDTEFAPAPVHGPDVIATTNLIGLRIFEGLCAVVIIALVWFCVIRPWLRRPGGLTLDGTPTRPRRRGCALYVWLRSRFPPLSVVALLSLVFVAEFAFNFLIPLTLWAAIVCIVPFAAVVVST